jgi:ribose transport system substrate-binding protein
VKQSRNSIVMLTLAIVLAATFAAVAAGSRQAPAANGVIGVSYPTVEGPWFTAVLYGMTQEAKRQGYDLTVLSAGGYQNVDTQVNQMADLVQRRVDGILTAVADPKALAPQIKAARSAGIPVVSAGEQGKNVVSSVTASHCTLGKEMAAGAKKLLPNGGKIAALTGPAGAFWTVARWDCFKKALGGKYEIVAQQWSEPSVAEGLRLAEDILQRNPDVQLIYGVDDTVGVGAARAIQQGPGCSKVRVVSAILSTESEKMLKNGCIDWLVAQQTVRIGTDSVATLIKALKGQKVRQSVEVPNIIITAKNLGSVKLASIRQPAGWKPKIG